MKIRIKNKSKSIYIVFINDDIWGILPKKILHFFHILPEKELNLTNEEIKELKVEIEKFAWNKFCNYLSYRERSFGESKTYLSNLPLNQNIVKKLLDKAISYNYINEKRFAELYVDSLIQKGKNVREAKAKLIAKHINSDIINETISSYYSPNIQKEILKKNINKVFTRYSNFPQEIRKQKCLNNLTQKGFSYWEIKEILDKM